MVANVAGRTAIGAGWLVAWRMASRGLGLISTLVLARLLLPADFGVMAMAIAFTGAVQYLSAIGLLDALIRRPDTGEEWFNTAFGFQALRAVLTGLIIALGAETAGAWFNEPRLPPILYVLAGTAALSGFENIGVVQYRRAIDFSVEFRLQIVPRLVQFFVMMGLAFVLRDYRAMLVGAVASAVVRLFMTYRLHPWRPHLPSVVRLQHWRGLLGFSAWTWAAGLASLVWERCDPFILGPALGTGNLGRYLLAAEISIMPLTEIVAPAMAALYAGISAARAKGTDIAAMTPTLCLALLSLLLPISIGLSATSGYIVAGLLGPQWEDVRPIIAVFAWVGCLSPINYVCNTILTAEGRVRRGFYAVAAAAITRVILMIIVVQTGHIDWAPVAALVAVFMEVLYFLSQMRFHAIRWRDHTASAARLIIAALATVALFAATGLAWAPVTLDAIMALAVGGALGLGGIVVFFTTQVGLWRLMGAPDGAERHVLTLVRSALPRP